MFLRKKNNGLRIIYSYNYLIYKLLNLVIYICSYMFLFVVYLIWNICNKILNLEKKVIYIVLIKFFKKFKIIV